MTHAESEDSGFMAAVTFLQAMDLSYSAAGLLISASIFVFICSWVCLFFFLSLSRDSPLFDFIESCLRNKHEMVVYEAASAIVNLPNCTAKELAPAVSGKCDAHGNSEGVLGLHDCACCLH